MKKTAFMFLTVFILACPSISLACSEVLFHKGGASVTARTMDFEVPMGSKIIVYPRGIERKSIGLDPGDVPLHWKSKYGSATVMVFDQAVTDGMNEKGLTAALLMFHETVYPPKDDKPALSYNYWAQYFLDNFKTVNEAVRAAKKIRVVPVSSPGEEKNVFPLHLIIHDAHGNTAVMEYVGGKLNIYKNPTHPVLTNDPGYEKQYKLLEKYVGFGGNEPIPGGYTPPERFARLAYYLKKLPKPARPEDAAGYAFDLIQTVTQPPSEPALTRWTAVRDIKEKKFYIRTFTDPCIKLVDLEKFDFSPSNPPEEISLTSPICGEVTADSSIKSNS